MRIYSHALREWHHDVGFSHYLSQSRQSCARLVQPSLRVRLLGGDHWSKAAITGEILLITENLRRCVLMDTENSEGLVAPR